MPDTTTNLMLSYLRAGQAQKHVTLNESLRRLDAVVQLAVVSATTTAQPGAPAAGAVYLLPAGKTGVDWAGMGDGALAYYSDGVWEQIAPHEGWLAFVKDTDQLLYHTGATWGQAPLAVSATDKVFGRISSGAGPVEEVSFTDQAQQLCDDTSFAAMRTTLGLGSAAVEAIGVSGNAVPKLNGAGTSWSSSQRAPGWHSNLVNIGDDAVHSFTPPSATGLMLLEDFQAGGVFFFRCDGTTGASIVAADTRYAVANGVLGGTTGADGKITISGHTDGKIYIENRIGGSRPITYTVLDM